MVYDAQVKKTSVYVKHMWKDVRLGLTQLKSTSNEVEHAWKVFGKVNPFGRRFTRSSIHKRHLMR